MMTTVYSYINCLFSSDSSNDLGNSNDACYSEDPCGSSPSGGSKDPSESPKDETVVGISDSPNNLGIHKTQKISPKGKSLKHKAVVIVNRHTFLDISDDDDDYIEYMPQFRASLFNRGRTKDQGNSKEDTFCSGDPAFSSSLPGSSDCLEDLPKNEMISKNSERPKDLGISGTQKCSANDVNKLKAQKQKADIIINSNDSRASDIIIKRNPVRTTRSKRKVSKDELYEKDLAFLDSMKGCENHAVPSKRARYSPPTVMEHSSISVQEKAKDTKKKKAVVKKNKSIIGKEKKKCAAKRKIKSTSMKTVPLEELKQVVNSTTEVLKDYLQNIIEPRLITNQQSEICTPENRLQVLKNQFLLFSIVNNLNDEDEVMEKFKLLNRN